MTSVRKICNEYEIPGLIGPIIELLDCDEKFFTAVEVTAGNRFGVILFFCYDHVEMVSIDAICTLCSLFHVVVETDEISTQIIRHLNALKGGRVTFIPLNRVKAPHVNYPRSSDVIPLLKKLKFSAHHAPAFQQVSF